MVTAPRTETAKPFFAIFIQTGAAQVMDGLKRIARRLGETDFNDTDGFRDPLSHPALKAMSRRELADLPFPRNTGISRGR